MVFCFLLLKGGGVCVSVFFRLRTVHGFCFGHTSVGLKEMSIGAFLSGQSDRIVIPFGP